MLTFTGKLQGTKIRHILLYSTKQISGNNSYNLGFHLLSNWNVPYFAQFINSKLLRVNNNYKFRKQKTNSLTIWKADKQAIAHHIIPELNISVSWSMMSCWIGSVNSPSSFNPEPHKKLQLATTTRGQGRVVDSCLHWACTVENEQKVKPMTYK